MCLAPRLVCRPSSTYSGKVTSLSVLDKGANSRVYKSIRPHSEDFAYNNILVPCGKCSQCLRKRQNDLAARCAIEANKLGSMQFVTLTYRDDTVPLSKHMFTVDVVTGESDEFDFSKSKFEVVERGSDFDLECRDLLSKQDRKKVRYVYYPIKDGDGNDLVLNGSAYYAVVTQSLFRRDVQLWLKSCRVQYEREFKMKLKKFSYVCCGEYGPNTFRPHYHVAFFGLSRHIVDWMASRWERQFGFTQVKSVFAVNPDGSSGYDICARYIGKYMSKGVFDCESVQNGCALKPRLMCSLHLGNMEQDKPITDELLSYYRCYDLVGEYDINTGLFKDGSPLQSSHYDLIAKELPKRNTFSFHGKLFPIPNKVKHYVWFTKNADGCLVSSRVRKEISSRLRFDFFEDFVRKLTEDYSIEPSREILSQINEFILVQLGSNSIADVRGFAAMQKFYSKSKF